MTTVTITDSEHATVTAPVCIWRAAGHRPQGRPGQLWRSQPMDHGMAEHIYSQLRAVERTVIGPIAEALSSAGHALAQVDPAYAAPGRQDEAAAAGRALGDATVLAMRQVLDSVTEVYAATIDDDGDGVEWEGEPVWPGPGGAA